MTSAVSPRAEIRPSPFTVWLRRYRLPAFFVLSYLLAWWSWPLSALGVMPNSFWACGPLIAALVVVGLTEGRAGLRDLGARMIRWRVGWVWYVVAIGLPLLVLLAAASLTTTLWGAPFPVFGDLAWSGFALAFAVRLVNPLDGPIGEEPGWRGYAVPRLQENRSRLPMAMLLGVVIAGWHLPLVVSGDLGLAGLPTTFSITLVYVWLFNRASGSVLLTILFHVTQGSITFKDLGFAGADLSRMEWASGIVWTVAALAVVGLDRKAWRTPPPV